MIDAISFDQNRIKYLDQRFLPLKETYVDTNDYLSAIEAIKTLAVRGAPLIGIVAGYTVVLAVQNYEGKKKDFKAYFTKIIAEVEASRPTAVNLFYATARMKAVFNNHFENSQLPEFNELILKEARAIHEKEIQNCEDMARFGVEQIKKDLGHILAERKLNVLTHCNTGTLATGGLGTALGVIKKAYQEGLINCVYTAESRPLLQGLRLTAWELEQEQIPFFSHADSSSGILMQRGKVDFAIVGADRIAANGDTANKIGTFNHAVLCHEHGLPFYIAAPLSTIDTTIPDGTHIPIEERNGDELRSIYGRQVATASTPVVNYAFDMTPAKFIRGIITETAALSADYVQAINSAFESSNSATVGSSC